MQIVDSNGNVFGAGLEVTGPDGKPKGGGSGAQGPVGPQGIQGSIGSQGFTGSQGIQGFIGVQGSNGTQGSTGTGSQGVQGVQGVTGTGSQGTTGIQGIQGSSGSGGSSSGIHTAIPVTQLLVNPGTFATTAAISAGSLGTIAMIANNLILNPYKPQTTFTSTALYINVTSLVAGALARVLIYSDNNGNPQTKLYESADLDCSTTGVKTALTAFTFTAGTTYWMATYSNSTPTVTAYAAGNIISIFSFGSASYTAQRNSGVTFGTAPTTYSLSSYTNASVPTVFIRV